MTHANLPASRVAEACRLTIFELEETLKDDEELPIKLRRNYEEGVSTKEQIESSLEFNKASQDRRLAQFRRIGAIRSLALAAEGGTIALDIEDFAIIAEHGKWSFSKGAT